jgi:hypothetical protein
MPCLVKKRGPDDLRRGQEARFFGPAIGGRAATTLPDAGGSEAAARRCCD